MAYGILAAVPAAQVAANAAPEILASVAVGQDSRAQATETKGPGTWIKNLGRSFGDVLGSFGEGARDIADSGIAIWQEKIKQDLFGQPTANATGETRKEASAEARQGGSMGGALPVAALGIGAAVLLAAVVID